GPEFIKRAADLMNRLDYHVARRPHGQPQAIRRADHRVNRAQRRRNDTWHAVPPEPWAQIEVAVVAAIAAYHELMVEHPVPQLHHQTAGFAVDHRRGAAARDLAADRERTAGEATLLERRRHDQIERAHTLQNLALDLDARRHGGDGALELAIVFVAQAI